MATKKPQSSQLFPPERTRKAKHSSNTSNLQDPDRGITARYSMGGASGDGPVVPDGAMNRTNSGRTKRAPRATAPNPTAGGGDAG